MNDPIGDQMMDDVSDYFERHVQYVAGARRLSSWDEVRPAHTGAPPSASVAQHLRPRMAVAAVPPSPLPCVPAR